VGARLLLANGLKEAVGGWSAELTATATFDRIRESPTAWALFDRAGFV